MGPGRDVVEPQKAAVGGGAGRRVAVGGNPASAGRGGGRQHLRVAAAAGPGVPLGRGRRRRSARRGPLDQTLAAIHPDDRQRVKRRLRAAARTGGAGTIGFRDNNPGPAMRYLSATFFAVGPERPARRIEIIVQDVTKAALTEIALRESVDHYRTAVELNPEIPWLADPDGSIIEVGPRWLEMVDARPGTRLGRGLLRALHPDDVEPTTAAWRRGAAQRRALRHRISRPAQGRALSLDAGPRRSTARCGRPDRPLVRGARGHPRAAERGGGAARERGVRALDPREHDHGDRGAGRGGPADLHERPRAQDHGGRGLRGDPQPAVRLVLAGERRAGDPRRDYPGPPGRDGAADALRADGQGGAAVVGPLHLAHPRRRREGRTAPRAIARRNRGQAERGGGGGGLAAARQCARKHDGQRHQPRSRLVRHLHEPPRRGHVGNRGPDHRPGFARTVRGRCRALPRALPRGNGGTEGHRLRGLPAQHRRLAGSAGLRQQCRADHLLPRCDRAATGAGADRAPGPP